MMAAELEKRNCRMQSPVVVLSCGRWSPEPDGDDEVLAARVARWTELQRELGRCAARGDHRIALNSGHNIQLTEPQLIVDAVARLIHPGAR